MQKSHFLSSSYQLCCPAATFLSQDKSLLGTLHSSHIRLCVNITKLLLSVNVLLYSLAQLPPWTRRQSVNKLSSCTNQRVHPYQESRRRPLHLLCGNRFSSFQLAGSLKRKQERAEDGVGLRKSPLLQERDAQRPQTRETGPVLCFYSCWRVWTDVCRR